MVEKCAICDKVIPKCGATHKDDYHNCEEFLECLANNKMTETFYNSMRYYEENCNELLEISKSAVALAQSKRQEIEKLQGILLMQQVDWDAMILH